MATINSFEDIEAWKLARELTREVYVLSSDGAFAGDFALRDQIRRASISIVSNIAEGFERGSTKEFIQFLGYAMGSAAEVQAQLYLALDQGYIDEPTLNRLREYTRSIRKALNGLTKYLRNSGYRGTRLKGRDREL